MEQVRFRTVEELVETKTLAGWHVSQYAKLLQSLRKKTRSAPSLEDLEVWLWAHSWRGHSLILWLVDDKAEQVIATAQASIVDTFVPKIYVNDVAVALSRRRQGQGKRLMLEMIVRAKARWPKADRIELTSNPRRGEARAMYRSLGFVTRDTDVFTLFLEGKAADG